MSKLKDQAKEIPPLSKEEKKLLQRNIRLNEELEECKRDSAERWKGICQRDEIIDDLKRQVHTYKVHAEVVRNLMNLTINLKK